MTKSRRAMMERSNPRYRLAEGMAHMREAWIAREAFACGQSINVDNFRRFMRIILPHPPRPSFRRANSGNPEFALDSAAWS